MISLEIFEYLKRKQRKDQQRTSNFRYIDRNLASVNELTQSKTFFTLFDQVLEYLHAPVFDLSIRYLDIQYTTMYESFSFLFFFTMKSFLEILLLI